MVRLDLTGLHHLCHLYHLFHPSRQYPRFHLRYRLVHSVHLVPFRLVQPKRPTNPYRLVHGLYLHLVLKYMRTLDMKRHHW